MERLAWKSVFFGAVQGVGFRQSVKGLAIKCGVCGFVQNEPKNAADGDQSRVLLLAYGSEEEVACLHRRIDEKWSHAIRWTDRRPVPPADFDGFEIR